MKQGVSSSNCADIEQRSGSPNMQIRETCAAAVCMFGQVTESTVKSEVEENGSSVGNMQPFFRCCRSEGL